MAKKFAKMILCFAGSGEDECKSCLMFDEDNHPDYYELNKDKTESIKIDDIRILQDKVIEKPITSKKKVYVINNSENMTVQAQNCLLKTLEEPPEFVSIILVTNNENSILTTIKSRCTKFLFSDEEVSSMTDEEKNSYNALEKIFGHVEDYVSIDLLGAIDELYGDKEHILTKLDFINMILMDKAKSNYKYLDYIDIVEETKRKIRANGNFDMSIDYLILKIWE